MNLSATPHKSFPLRLEHGLATTLDRVSKETQIPKTRIITIGLEKFLSELSETGVSSAMKQVCQI